MEPCDDNTDSTDFFVKVLLRGLKLNFPILTICMYVGYVQHLIKTDKQYKCKTCKSLEHSDISGRLNSNR